MKASLPLGSGVMTKNCRMNNLGLLYSGSREESSSSDDEVSSLDDTSFMRYGDSQRNGCHVDNSSILSTDHSEEDDYHIFTDDEETASPVELLSEAESAALNEDSSSVKTPTTWAHYNQERGRLLAQTLLKQSRPYDDYDSEEEEETPKQEQQRRRPRRGGKKKRRTSFLGRAVQSLRFHKRRIKSSSPLDKTVATAASAVDTRNHLVDFGAWEARAGVIVSPTPKSCDDSVTSWKSTRSWKSTTSIGSVMSFKRITTPIKKLFSPSKDSEQEETMSSSSVADDDLMDPAIPTIAAQGLESRVSSEDIVLELGLGEDGYRLLQALRGKAGMVDLEEEDGSVEDRSIPLIHLLNDIWVPHYEEYVIRAVNAFMHFLLGS